MRKADLEAAVTKALEERNQKNKETERVKKLFETLIKEFETFINSIHSERFPFKVGYEWRRNENNKLFKWELVKVENGKGTEGNPILFIPPMYCYADAYYTYMGKHYVCVLSGYHNDIENADFFAEV